MKTNHEQNFCKIMQNNNKKKVARTCKPIVYALITSLTLCLSVSKVQADDFYVECELVDKADMSSLSTPLDKLHDSFRKNPNSIIAWAYYAKNTEVITNFGIDRTMDKSYPIYDSIRNQLKQYEDWLKQGLLTKVPNYNPVVKFKYFREHRCSILHSEKNRQLADIWSIYQEPWDSSSREIPPNWTLKIIPDPKSIIKKVKFIELKCTRYDFTNEVNPIPQKFTEIYKPSVSNPEGKDSNQFCTEEGAGTN